MSKSVLIMDMPESCEQCLLRKGRLCFPASKKDCVCDVYHAISEGKRAEFCPLKQMPEQNNITFYISDGYQDGYKDGWNDCINEICRKNGL